jgi:hypothetical protein
MGVCVAKIGGECGAHAWSGDIIGLAALRGNNVITDILFRINGRTGIDILHWFALKDIQQESDGFIALLFRSLVDGSRDDVILHQLDCFRQHIEADDLDFAC